jgi:DNA polymerase elongation subunit (family B)
LEDVGIEIHPGEKVRYVIKDAESKEKAERVRPFPLVGPDDTYDVKKYLEMLVKATEELLIHFGYDAKRLRKKLQGFEGPSPPAAGRDLRGRVMTHN